MKDNRKKGCPNPDCKKNKDHFLFKATDKYCVECATPLIFVCKDCFKKLEDLGPKHVLCTLCEAKHKDDPMSKVKKTVKKAAKNTGKAVVKGAANAVVAVKDAGEAGIELVQQLVAKDEAEE